MATFLKRLGAFMAIQLVVAGVLLAFYRRVPEAYLAASVDKHALLARAPAPRLVLLGGSNLAFGVDSSALADRLAYHPVNMGLNASFGLAFMLREALPDVKAGDVVVLAPEYEHFIAPQASGPLLAVMEHRPANLRYLSWAQLPAVLDNALLFVGRQVRAAFRIMRGRKGQRVKPPYCRSGFNEYGDVVIHYRTARRDEDEEDAPPEFLPLDEAAFSTGHIERTIRTLNAFEAACRKKGARVFLSYPAYPEALFEHSRPLIDEIDRRLRRSLAFPILMRPENMVLPDELFYDTAYHLKAEGTRRRTARLLEALKPSAAGP